jgi:hypothetical protein
MEAIEFIAKQALYILSITIVILAISFIFRRDPENVAQKVQWIINSAIGGLLTYFVLATFLDYFGYLE